MPEKWVTLTGVSTRAGYGKVPVLERVLADFKSKGKIKDWRFVDVSRYDVLTDKDISKLEAEILGAIRGKLRR